LLGSIDLEEGPAVQHPNIAFVEGIYRAFQAGDTASVAAALSPNVRWSTSGWGPTSGTVEGVPAVLAYLFEDNHMDDYGLEVLDVLASDEQAAVVARTSGRRGASRIVNDYIQLIRIVDGLVADVRTYYWDQRAVAEFMTTAIGPAS
jgi:ketosteroid isomerase-like protein